MSGAASILAKLVADCDAHGIRLLPTGDSGLTIDAPQEALTLDLLNRPAHKADVMMLLQSTPDAAQPFLQRLRIPR